MKKIISVILVVFLLITTLSVSAEELFYDSYVEETNSILLLHNLLSLPEEHIKSEEVTTRAVFCAMLGKALDLNVKDASLYKDVSFEHWAAGYINGVSNSGILKSVGNGYFFPDEPIKADEIIDAITDIVYCGNYLEGLLSLHRLGITDGLDTTKEYFTNEETATLVLQMLENRCYQIRSVSSGTTEMRLASPMLERIHNIYEREGVLDLVSNSGEQKYVTLDGVSYEYSSELDYIKFLLSKRVVAYTVEDEFGDRILHIEEEDDRNTKKVLSEDVVFNKDGISYYIGHKRRNLKMSQNPLIYINGELYTSYNWDELNHSVGWTEFVDNNDDGYVDSVLQYRPVNALVSMVNSGKRLIEDFYQTNSLDLSDNDISYAIFDEDGSVINLNEIEKWDVLSIFKDSKEKDIIIIRSADSVSGLVTGMSDDTCEIDGELYGIDNEYLSSKDYKLTIGMQGTFYLNMFGNIVSSRTGGTDKDYGILVSATEDKDLDNNIFIKVYTENGKFEVFQSKDKLKLNGQRETAKNVYTFLKSQEMYQLIRYKVNNENILTDIDFAQLPQNDGAPYDTSCFTLNYKGSSKLYFDIIGPGYKADAKTRVFVIPQDRTDKTSYQIGDKTLLPTDYTDVSFYDCAENYYINIAVVEYKSGKGASDSIYGQNFAVIQRFGKALGHTEDVVPVIYYSQMGQEGSIKVKSNGLRSLESKFWPEYSGMALESLKPGDVIQFTTDAFGELNEFHVLYASPYPIQYLEKGTTTPTKDFMVAMLTTCYGKVLHKNSEAIIVNANGMGDVIDHGWSRIYRTAGLSVTLVIQGNSKTEILKGGKEDIEIGDSVFVRVSNGSAKELIIYRKDV